MHMLKRIGCIAVWGAAMAALLLPVPVLAQAASADPDLRELEPYFMLVVDTSGSMELLPTCHCKVPGGAYCGECLPKCDLANVNGVAPEDKKNRWAITLEALTGTFNDFQCEAVPRSLLLTAPPNPQPTYDKDFFYPYDQPWDCSNAPPLTPCAYDPTKVSQNQNGIIDDFKSRVRFGLMTFDGVDTYTGANLLISDFDQARANTIDGLWSYGGAQTFRYYGCDKDYKMDTGVRNASATEGGLISLNSCAGPPPCAPSCSTCPGTVVGLNNDIEVSLLKSRPYGSTPIAGSLSDLDYHLRHDLPDQFGSCRARFALLLTDGRPDDDYHKEYCDCGVLGEQDCPGHAPRSDFPDLSCPYHRATWYANRLVKGDVSNPAKLSRLFVVGMAVDDTDSKDALNSIAMEGCKDCVADANGNVALFANDFDSLTSSLKKAINTSFAPVSRSVPSFASGTGGGQYQVSAGFRAYGDPDQPWEGRLERRRFLCDGAVAVPQELEDSKDDLLHAKLNGNNQARKLTTVVPSGATTVAAMAAQMTSMVGGSCPVGGCDPVPLSSISTAAQFGVTLGSEVQAIKNWMQGGQGTPRPAGLGDIYHSSPVIVASPQFDSADEAYNLFRRQAVVEHRPTTVYVNSNDGVIHAFSLEAHAASTGHVAVTAGQEMWGFVPPLLLGELKKNLAGHQLTMDGTPVVRDVYFNRTLSKNAADAEYHTVLVTGMRNGGNSYIALDVTDPQFPKFLWQFNDHDMGKTYAQPALGQAVWKIGANDPKNGAIAILPGGVGEEGSSPECSNVSSPSNGYALSKRSTGSANGPVYYTLPYATGNSSVNHHNHRAAVRCWKRTGRALYIVDVQTGELIRKIKAESGLDSDPPMFPSPLVSGAALYQADIGSVASRAFVMDADGVIWRIDLSHPDPTHWVANPFHDMFWDKGAKLDKGAKDGERSYEAPLLSVDEQGQLVVIVGTGDTDNFIKPTIENRIASLTEEITGSGTLGPGSYQARLNWELGVPTPLASKGLVPSELVTGTMALFQGQLFFGTFIAVDSSDACAYGRGRMHAVDYHLPDLTVHNRHTEPDGSLSTTSSGAQSYGPLRLNVGDVSVGATNVINVSETAAISNFMVMGLNVTQRPPCSTTETEGTDIYNQTHALVTDLTPPPVYLVAQASGTSNLVTRAAQSALGNVELQLKPKKILSRVTSWATSVD